MCKIRLPGEKACSFVAINHTFYHTQKFLVMRNLRNSVQLIGNLGRDPQFIELESGKKLVKFTLATNEYYRVGDERKQRTHWHNVVAWNKTAELMRDLLQKGSQVAVHGKLTHRSYEDKEGQTKYVSEIVANEFVSFKNSNLPM
jgi:single-strand DNA-binding protein